MVGTSFLWKCHRGDAQKASKVEEEHQRRRGKKLGCPFGVRGKLVVGDDGCSYMEFTEHGGHMGHTPGDASDMSWLPITTTQQESIKEVSL